MRRNCLDFVLWLRNWNEIKMKKKKRIAWVVLSHGRIELIKRKQSEHVDGTAEFITCCLSRCIQMEGWRESEEWISFEAECFAICSWRLAKLKPLNDPHRQLCRPHSIYYDRQQNGHKVINATSKLQKRKWSERDRKTVFISFGYVISGWNR